MGIGLNTLGDKPSGTNINHKCGSLFPEKASQIVKKKKSDLGICLDGDGDRVIFIDEKGNITRGEEIIFLISKFYIKNKLLKKGSTIVTNEIANFGLDDALKKLGLKLKRVKVGDKNILEEINKNKYFFGAEPSGHFIFKDDLLIGDGMTTAIRVLSILIKEKKKLTSENLIKFMESNNIDEFDINEEQD